MYRKPDGSYGASFGHFINNFIPSMMGASGDPGHVSMPQKDMFFSHHINQSDPCALCPTSLWASAIIDHKTVSGDIFKKLQKIGVVSQQGIVDTTKIDAKFTHHLAKIPAYQQKQVIDLLFWWEEECGRFRKLQGEEAELTALIRDYANDRDVYSRMLNRVRNKKKTVPSQRNEAVERDEDEEMVRFRSGMISRTTTSHTFEGDPPPYSAR